MDPEDMMHNVFLGHGQDCIASTLKSLLDDGRLPPGSPDHSLGMVHVEFRKWCKDRGLKLPTLPLSLNLLGLGGGGREFAVLHSKVKAANVRVLLAFVADLACRLCDGSDLSRIRATCVVSLERFCRACDIASFMFDDDTLNVVLSAGRSYLLCYQKLAIELDGHFLYKLRPKLHYYAHMLLWIEATRRNPRKVPICSAAYLV